MIFDNVESKNVNDNNLLVASGIENVKEYEGSAVFLYKEIIINCKKKLIDSGANEIVGIIISLGLQAYKDFEDYHIITINNGDHFFYNGIRFNLDLNLNFDDMKVVLVGKIK